MDKLFRYIDNCTGEILQETQVINGEVYVPYSSGKLGFYKEINEPYKSVFMPSDNTMVYYVYMEYR